jgi:hypothetical protein
MRAPPDVRWRPSLKAWWGLRLSICLVVPLLGMHTAHAGEAPKTTAPAKKTAVAKPAPAQRSSQPAQPRDDAPADLAESLTPDASGERLASQELRPVITGDAWQDTLLRFDQWLSVQTLYDDQQVKQMRSKFAAAAKGAAATNRKQFIKDTEDKLDILYSPSTSQLQRHFAEHMATAAPAYLKKSRQQLPDVVSLNPQQLKDRLWRFGQRYEANVDVHQTFEQMRHMHIAAQERSDARRFEQPRPAASHVASSPGGGNRSSRSGYTQARDYFPQNNSSISYTVIPAMPIFTNSGYAMFGGGVAITITRNR